ncbi:MAG: glycosyltransferase family 2 protein, partial [Balneolaceae bacterium]
MIIYEVTQYILIAIGGGLLGYQMLLSFLALLGKDIKNFHTEKKRKFVIVIPAHNEEQVIAKTIYSLFGLVYPKSLYHLVVVADNCTDHTARIARKLGAKVLERTNKEKRGKGYALRWAFDQLLSGDEEYEGVIVLDSDSLIS